MRHDRSTDPANFIGPDPRRDSDAEIEFHLEMIAAAHRAAGLDPGEARRRAEAEFGDVARAKTECRTILGRVEERRDRAAWLTAARRDVRYALRSLRRTPGFGAVMVLTIGVALGFATLIAGSLRGLLLRPLPFPNADRLVWVFATDRERATGMDRVSSDEAKAMSDEGQPFERLAVFGDRNLVRTEGIQVARWIGLRVTPGMPGVLGIRPALGRSFTPEEASQGAAVMMVGYERWQRDFGGDSSLIGRRLSFFDSKSFTIVGILPPGLAFPLGRSPDTGGFGSGVQAGIQDFWIPMNEESGGTMLGRLQPGATVGQARVMANAVSGRLQAVRITSTPGRILTVVPMRDQILGVAAPALRLLVVAAALVLLLALANLANLMAARASARETEFLVRLALGARPGSNARILLTETGFLARAGAVLGIALAQLGVVSLARFASGQLPLGEQIRIDGPVLAVALVLALVVTAVLTLAPLAIFRRWTPASLTPTTGSGPTVRQSRLRRALVMSQVAAALLLLAGEAAVLKSLARLMTLDLGYSTTRVVSADLNVYRYPGGRAIYAELVRRVSELPGVEAVGTIHSIPLTGKWTFREPLIEAGRPAVDSAARLASGNFVGYDYFGVMGIPVLAGRGFIRSDYDAPIAPAIIINQTAATRFFPAGAVGAVVQLAGAARTIVGVVKDTRDIRIDLETEPQWYLPGVFEGSQLMVRTRAAPAGMLEPIRRTMVATDPSVVVHRIEPLEVIASATLFERRLAVGLLGLVGVLALLIATVGIYGVLSYTVSERQRELGLRMAVGASPARLLALVLRNGLATAGIGIAIGLALTVPLRGAVRGMLYQAGPAEPALLLAVAAGLLLVALLACLGPAWRAARVDPVRVLKGE